MLTLQFPPNPTTVRRSNPRARKAPFIVAPKIPKSTVDCWPSSPDSSRLGWCMQKVVDEECKLVALSSPPPSSSRSLQDLGSSQCCVRHAGGSLLRRPRATCQRLAFGTDGRSRPGSSRCAPVRICMAAWYLLFFWPCTRCSARSARPGPQ